MLYENKHQDVEGNVVTMNEEANNIIEILNKMEGKTVSSTSLNNMCNDTEGLDLTFTDGTKISIDCKLNEKGIIKLNFYEFNYE